MELVPKLATIKISLEILSVIVLSVVVVVAAVVIVVEIVIWLWSCCRGRVVCVVIVVN